MKFTRKEEFKHAPPIRCRCRCAFAGKHKKSEAEYMPTKAIERLELISKVARELQGRMTFDDIDFYLRSCGVTVKHERGSYDSKWVYAKELLVSKLLSELLMS
jgi:hypothetical protein